MPAAFGSSSGSTKNHRNSCTSSGMLRKNSTYAKPNQFAPFDGSVRITPTIEPVISAITQASAAVLRVSARPDNSMSR